MLQKADEFLRQVAQAGDSEQKLDDVILAHREFLAQQFPPEARAPFIENPSRYRRVRPDLIREIRRLRYDLRFLALVVFLRETEPIERVGNTIYIYEVTEQDLEHCCNRCPTKSLPPGARRDAR